MGPLNSRPNQQQAARAPSKQQRGLKVPRGRNYTQTHENPAAGVRFPTLEKRVKK